jgi:hypothetical protein
VLDADDPREVVDEVHLRREAVEDVGLITESTTRRKRGSRRRWRTFACEPVSSAMT